MTKKRKSEESDRRRWPRLNPADVPFLKRVEFYQGSEVIIVNISRGGLLLETEARLRPDLKIMLKIVTTKGVLKMDGMILRSSIYSLNGVPRYRTAIAFKNPFDLLDDVKGASGEQVRENAEKSAVPGIFGEDNGDQLHRISSKNGDQKIPTILTVIASDANGVCLQENFELNDW